jgi:hypothetical protein
MAKVRSETGVSRRPSYLIMFWERSYVSKVSFTTGLTTVHVKIVCHDADRHGSK